MFSSKFVNKVIICYIPCCRYLNIENGIFFINKIIRMICNEIVEFIPRAFFFSKL